MPKKIDYHEELKGLKGLADNAPRPITTRLSVGCLRKLYQLCDRDGLDLSGLVRQILEEQADLYLEARRASYGASRWRCRVAVHSAARGRQRTPARGPCGPLLPLLWCACHVAKSSSNLLLGRAVDQFGPRPFMFLGWLVFAAIYLAFALATAAWQVWAFFLAYGLVIGLIEPAERTLVANLVGSERKGLAYGWYNCAIGVATLPSSLIFGALYQFFGALAAFGWGAALALVAVAILVGVRGRAKTPPL